MLLGPGVPVEPAFVVVVAVGAVGVTVVQVVDVVAVLHGDVAAGFTVCVVVRGVLAVLGCAGHRAPSRRVTVALDQPGRGEVRDGEQITDVAVPVGRRAVIELSTGKPTPSTDPDFVRRVRRVGGIDATFTLAKGRSGRRKSERSVVMSPVDRSRRIAD